MASPVAEQIDAHIAKRQALVKQLNALMTAAAETSRGLTADEAKEHDLILEQLDAMDEHAKRFARWITGF